MRTVTLTAALFSMGAFSNQASADVYKYVAPNGTVYYTDQPPNSNYKLILRSTTRSMPKTSVSLEKNKNQFSPLINSVAQKHRLDPKLLHAVIRVESAYDPKAISHKGAVGLMQLMPETAKRYGVTDLRDPNQNLEGGARYLRDLLGMFNSDLRLALAGYNAGENAVIRHNHKIPPYPETQDYVKRVLDLYGRYTKL